MKFFSGFSLQNDAKFFRAFIKESDFCVSGFSYGAIKAFEYTQQLLEEGKRVDTLQLFSPAISFKRSADAYIEQFITSCFSPYNVEYEWSKDALLALQKRGVSIEVYLGGRDKIIDVNAARAFFLEMATVTYIKEANHFLQLS